MRSSLHWLLVAIGLFAGCGGRPAKKLPPDVWAQVQWHDAPASAADIGYEVNVEVGSRNSRGSCTAPPPPDLRVTVNDREAVSLGTQGDCDWNVVFRLRGFAGAGSVTVRVFDDAGDVGEARYEGLFPGAAAVVTPPDGRVAAGGEVVVTIPAGVALLPSPVAQFYWRDSPAGGPPLVTAAPGQLAPDGLSVTAQVPNLVGVFGRAALIFDLADVISRGSDACMGLSSCTSTVAGVLGPFELDVLPVQP